MMRGFSILWRISCGATPAHCHHLFPHHPFQYSLANLVRCNLSCKSNPVAQRASFSILWRISCGATPKSHKRPDANMPFQYSLANLVWCNIAILALSTYITYVSVFSGESRVVQRRLARRLCQLLLKFQYSLANLVWCNNTEETMIAATEARFSILWRISCGATYHGVGIHRRAGEFQYSLANLVWCNQYRLHNYSCIVHVFQYSLANLVWCNHFAGRHIGRVFDVSVFSGESRVVQHLHMKPARIRPYPFQYSLANLVWCNPPWACA